MKQNSSVNSIKKLDRNFLEAIIDNPYECPIIIDSNGVVLFLSTHSKELIGIDPNWAIGKHATEVFKDTNIHEVARSGKAKIGETMFVAGRYQVISRIPVRNKRGEIIGAIAKGMFYHTKAIKDLYKRLEVLDHQIAYYKKEIKSLTKSRIIIGQSSLIQKAKDMAFEVSGSDSSVLITGESGTGKESLSFYIHQNSKRADGPFVRVNCAAIPHELFESELFGYEAGAFTGARSKGKPGKFELAKSGTILLDEIGDMPFTMQAKLLRVLQEHEVERIGGTRTIPLDFRLITSTNKNLVEMIQSGTFRSDLYFRINTFQIHMPSLREIPEDIPLIADHIMSLLKEDVGYNYIAVSKEAMELLKRYTWPGNVRDLRNAIESALIMSKGKQINPDHLPRRVKFSEDSGNITIQSKNSLKKMLEETEKKIIEQTLRSVRGNKARAAKILGLHRSSLYEKIKHHKVHEFRHV